MKPEDKMHVVVSVVFVVLMPFVAHFGFVWCDVGNVVINSAIVVGLLVATVWGVDYAVKYLWSKFQTRTPDDSPHD